MLLTLFTFERSSYEVFLTTAFEKRLEYEKMEHNQIIISNQFNESIKILLNGFVTSNLHNSATPVREYLFINPSLTDFLIGYVSASFPEGRSIISSTVYVEQLNRFNPINSLIPLEKELQIIIRDKISECQIGILEEFNARFTENKRHAIYLETLSKYCRDVNVDNLLLKHFKKLSFDENWEIIMHKIEYFLLNLGDAPQTFNYIKENFIEIIERIMSSISDSYYAKLIRVLFEKYQHNYDSYLESNDGFENLRNVIENVLKTKELHLNWDKGESVKDLYDAQYLYEEIDMLGRELRQDLFPNIILDFDFGIEMDKNYWEQKIEQNNYQMEKNKIRNEPYEDHYNVTSKSDEDNSIDDLFQKQV